MPTPTNATTLNRRYAIKPKPSLTNERKYTRYTNYK